MSAVAAPERPRGRRNAPTRPQRPLRPFPGPSRTVAPSPIRSAASASSSRLLPFRQFQVLDLAADGLMTRQVGVRLGISEDTAQRYLTRASLTLGVGEKAGMVGECYRLGVFVPRPLPPGVRRPVLACGLAPVLPLVARGRSNREIGAALGISAGAAGDRVRRLLRVFGAANRANLVRLAVDAGVLAVSLDLTGSPQ